MGWKGVRGPPWKMLKIIINKDELKHKASVTLSDCLNFFPAIILEKAVGTLPPRSSTNMLLCLLGRVKFQPRHLIEYSCSIKYHFCSDFNRCVVQHYTPKWSLEWQVLYSWINTSHFKIVLFFYLKAWVGVNCSKL